MATPESNLVSLPSGDSHPKKDKASSKVIDTVNKILGRKLSNVSPVSQTDAKDKTVGQIEEGFKDLSGGITVGVEELKAQETASVAEATPGVAQTGHQRSEADMQIARERLFELIGEIAEGRASIDEVPESARPEMMRLVEERRARGIPSGAPPVEAVPVPVAPASEPAPELVVSPAVEPVVPAVEASPEAAPVAAEATVADASAELERSKEEILRVIADEQAAEPVEVVQPKPESEAKWSSIVSQSQSELTDVQADSRRKIDRARKESEELEAEIKNTTLPQSEGRTTFVQEIKRQLELKQISQEKADSEIEKIVSPNLVKGREDVAHDRSSAEIEAESATSGLALLERWKYYLSHPEIARNVEAAVAKIAKMKREIEMSYVDNAAKYGQEVNLDDVRQKLEKGFITQAEADMLINKPAVLELRDAQAYLDSLRGQIPAEFLGQEADKINLDTVGGKITAEAVEKLRAINNGTVALEENKTEKPSEAQPVVTKKTIISEKGAEANDQSKTETGRKEQVITLTDEQKTNLGLLKLQLEGKTPEEQKNLINVWLENNQMTLEQWNFYLGSQPVIEGEKVGEQVAITLTDEQKTNLGLLKLQLEGKTPEEQEALIREWLENNGISREQWEYFKGLRIAEADTTIKETPTAPVIIEGQAVDTAATQAAKKVDDDGEAKAKEDENEIDQVDEPPVAPTVSASDAIINKLIAKYSNKDKEKEGRGKVRGFFVPIVAGLIGSRGAVAAANLVNLSAGAAGPLTAAIAGFGGSLATSVARAVFSKENAFKLFSRYSHTEPMVKGRGLNLKNGVAKAWRAYTRGTERATIRHLIKIASAPKEMTKLAFGVGQNGEPILNEQAIGIDKLKPSVADKLIADGVWYCLAIKASKALGAHFSLKETKYQDEWVPKTQAAVDILLNKYHSADRDKFLANLEEKIIRRERRNYIWKEILPVAGIGAVKSMLMFELVDNLTRFIEKDVTPIFGHKTPAQAKEPTTEFGTPNKPMPENQVTTPGIKTPDNSPDNSFGAPYPVPKPPEAPTTGLFPIHENVGHTLAENGKAVDWANTDQWTKLLAVNNTTEAIKQTELWTTGSQIAKAIAGDPDKYLVNLSVEDKALAFRMAKEAVAAFNKAGFDASTGLLTRPEALDRNEIIAAFWWVIQNKKLAA